MRKNINGISIEMTEEEILEAKLSASEIRYQEHVRPRTIDEGVLELQKTLLLQQLENNEDKTLAIACMALFDVWTNGEYKVGDIRTDPATGYPYECIQSHDSILNTTWTIEERSLWKPYHSREEKYALPWIKPTGSHDMYKTGEYMIWTDKDIYLCLNDTVHSPAEYSQAWERIEM